MTKIIPFSGLSGPTDNDTEQTYSESAEELPPSILGGVISIGNFDGVHLGHRTLLREVHKQADVIDGPAVVVIFDPHPATILRPGQSPPRLTWIERRAELLDQAGIDFLLVCETTRNFLNLSADAFFQSLVVDQLQARAVVEGPNFFFGHGRGGDVALMGELCEQNNIDFAVMRPTEDSGEMISSTRIRHLLVAGKIDEANAILGTPYRLRGSVTEGEKRGRKIGFPTANLTNIDVVTPGPGVYGGFVWIDGKSYDAAVNIGSNPTFDDDSLKVEIHALDFSGDLYGAALQLDVICHIRDVARFESAEQLVEQIDRDVHTIRTRLERYRQTAKDDLGTQRK